MSGEPGEVLRFATLNLWGENGPHERRLELVAEELARLEPDVVALQEVREAPGRLANQAATLAGRLGWAYAFAPATEWGGGVEGLAVLSRFAIAETSHRHLPHSTPTEGRIVLSARLDGPRGALWVHTAHLSYRHHEGREREAQVLVLDEEVSRRAAGAEPPAVLMGDLNTVPESDEIRWLVGLTTLDSRRVYYQDAWAVAHGHGAGSEQAGITWARENPFRERLGWLQPDRRLDYIFVTAARRDGRGRVRRVERAFDRPDAEGIYPSDHYGVVADVQIAPDEAKG